MTSGVPFALWLQPWECSGFRRGFPPVPCAVAKRRSGWTPWCQCNHQCQLVLVDPETDQRWADHPEARDRIFGSVPETTLGIDKRNGPGVLKCPRRWPGWGGPGLCAGCWEDTVNLRRQAHTWKWRVMCSKQADFRGTHPHAQGGRGCKEPLANQAGACRRKTKGACEAARSRSRPRGRRSWRLCPRGGTKS